MKLSIRRRKLKGKRTYIRIVHPELFSLAEYKVRSGASFEKGYLAGKYGATPILGNMSNLFVKEEQ